jgi:sugar phosphate isomerase/epimerase
MRFAFCNEGFGDRPWSAVCEAIAEAGYKGVEIAPFTFAETVQEIAAHQRSEIRRVARDAGLEIVGLHWLLVKPEGLHISHPDAAVRARTRDCLRYLADFCADVGGKIMVFGSPRQRGKVEDATANDIWRWAVATFAAVLPTAAERGVSLCIEPLESEETGFINTAAEGRRLVEELDHPSFRLMLDVKAMCAEGRPIPEIIESQRDILAHVHANDANRQGPGFGEVDFRPILTELREVGYEGYVSVEPFEFSPNVDEVARRSLGYLRECLSAGYER